MSPRPRGSGLIGASAGSVRRRRRSPWVAAAAASASASAAVAAVAASVVAGIAAIVGAGDGEVPSASRSRRRFPSRYRTRRVGCGFGCDGAGDGPSIATARPSRLAPAWPAASWAKGRVALLPSWHHLGYRTALLSACLVVESLVAVCCQVVFLAVPARRSVASRLVLALAGLAAGSPGLAVALAPCWLGTTTYCVTIVALLNVQKAQNHLGIFLECDKLCL